MGFRTIFEYSLLAFSSLALQRLTNALMAGYRKSGICQPL
jgi:hypothetical protein